MRGFGGSTITGFARLLAATFAGIVMVGWAASDPPGTPPLGGGDSVRLEPVSPPASPRRQRPIFVCRDGGVPAYSDRPCSPLAEPRALTVAMPEGGAATTTIPPAPRASTRPRRQPQWQESTLRPVTDSRCDTLERQLDQLNDRMRTGYSAREAARLWQRWRDLKERIRTARC